MHQQNYFGKDTPKLGFGMMRLPKIGDDFDLEQIKKMVDLFMDAGFTYFDTAYVYEGSEAITKKALVDRYPRDSYTLATKVNAHMHDRTEEESKEQIRTSLERTGAGYFDYYLLHALSQNNRHFYEDYRLWDYVKELKAEGLIRHYGFSYHDGPEFLDELLTAHPDVEFVQLQINYADWENPKVTSRANYEVARKHGKSIVIMEPVKGGALAEPAEDVQKLLRDANPDASFSSWAIRFAASLEGVITVLSGMSTLEQMQDNLSYMKNFQPMTEEEHQVIAKAQEEFGKSPAIACTACHYCTEGCPQQIAIPDIFTAMNKRLVGGRLKEAIADYEEVAPIGHKASDCISCNQCEDACPQHLEIINLLKECAEVLETEAG